MKDNQLTMYTLDYYQQSSTKPSGLKLGCRRIDQYGNIYRLAKAGATALAAGKCTVAPTATANHLNMSLATAAAIGDVRVQITLGATAATANMYEDGYMVVNDGTGEGHLYRIKSNPAADASAAIWIELEDPIRVALVTSATSEVSLFPNIFNGTVISATINNLPTGIPPIAVTAAYYYWSLVEGETPALGNGAEAVGSMLIHHTTDGAIGVMASSVDVDSPIIGIQLGSTHITGEYQPIYYKAV